MTDMQRVLGINLPASDTHFRDMINKGKLFVGKGTYQMNKLEAGLELTKSRRVALDIGAHVGLWTRVLAHYFDRVHAFEPLRAHADCLVLNTLGLHNVVLHDGIALGQGGSVDGSVPMLSVPDNTGNARVVSRNETIADATMVPVHPLTAFFPDDVDDVDFIKIDVEGYEMAVVLGGEQVIRRCKPAMVVEQKPGNAERYGWRTGEVLDVLKAWGARVAWTRSGDHGLTWG